MKTSQMMKVSLASVLASTGALSAHAAIEGGHSGNGGNIVACYADSSRKTLVSTEMFDYWEGEQNGKFGQVDLGAPSLSVNQKIAVFLARVDSFDPAFKKKIGDVASIMADNINDYLVTSAALPAIDDYTPRAIPSGNCFIEQFAAQWKDPTNGRRRFSISRKFYTNPVTTNDARAGLILHEAIYRAAIQLGHQDSDHARLYNYALATRSFEKADTNRYVTFVNAAKLNPNASECALRKMVFDQPLWMRPYTQVGYKLCYSSAAKNVDLQARLIQGSYLLHLFKDGKFVRMEFDNAPEFSFRFNGKMNPVRLDKKDNVVYTGSGSFDLPKLGVRNQLMSVPLNPSVPCREDGRAKIEQGKLIGCVPEQQYLVNLGDQKIATDGLLYFANNHFGFAIDKDSARSNPPIRIGDSLARVWGHYELPLANGKYNFEWVRFHGSALLRPLGAKKKYEIYGEGDPVQLAPTGEVLRGRLLKPLVDLKTAAGATVSGALVWILVDPKFPGKMKLTVESPHLQRYQGNQILTSGTQAEAERNRRLEVANRMCSSLGYEKSTGFFDHDAYKKEIMVTKPQLFFSLDAERVVNKVDEVVTVTEVQCTGMGYVDL